jgi:putative copper resistance protein D
MVNTWLVLGVWPINVASPYQELLLAKIGLVALMIGLAIVNRYFLVPRLRSAPGALRLLGSITIAEVAIGLGVIAFISIIGTLAPM